jgi:predicted DNA-binding transcriptional regulator AlpA
MEVSMPRLLSKKDVADLVGLHPEHIMRMAREGKFPKPIKLSASQNGRARFVDTEVDEWITAKMAERANDP